MYILFFILACFFNHAVTANEFDFSTRVFIDADQIGAFYQKNSNQDTANESALELRSVKTSLKYKANSVIGAKLQLEYKKEEENNYENEFAIDDAYLKLNLSDSFNIKLGQFKEPLGHSYLMSSIDSPTIERSMVSSAFSLGRNTGIGLEFANNQTAFQGMIMQINDDNIDQGRAATFRLSHDFSQIEDTNNALHLAFGTSYRDLNDSLWQIKERGEVNTADNIIRSARFYADNQSIYQLEAGSHWNNLLIIGEYYNATTHQIDGTDWHHQGFYLQVSGLLNLIHSSHARYAYKKGEFEKSKLQSHDIEWVIRYTGLSLRDYDVGSEASSVLLGLNYYFKKKTSLMLNLLLPSISGSVVNTNQDGQAISLRLKHEF